MGNWSSLQSELGKVETSRRYTWAELAALVGGLPPSAAKHRAWWGGDRPHVNAWRAAGFTVSNLAMGHEVTFVRTRAAGRPHGAQPAADLTGSPSTSGQPLHHRPKPDLLLVACVKQKLNVPAPAKDLYVSALFNKERSYAEHAGVPWFILSAEHGLVAPEEWLVPYERYLPETPVSFRSAWGPWVAERLELLTGAVAGKVIEVHAGASYLDEIRPLLQAKGATTVEPLRGLSMGQRLSWYSSESSVGSSATGDGAVSPTHDDAASFVKHLTDSSQSLHPSEFLALDGAGLRTPGLYSWWVDTTGADDLSHGLGVELQPGLIYAGLAGATLAERQALEEHSVVPNRRNASRRASPVLDLSSLPRFHSGGCS